MITSPAAGGRYYADDLRQVTEVGVKHVMKLFGRHFFPAKTVPSTAAAVGATRSLAAIQRDNAIICDEEIIETRAHPPQGVEPATAAG